MSSGCGIFMRANAVRTYFFASPILLRRLFASEHAYDAFLRRSLDMCQTVWYNKDTKKARLSTVMPTFDYKIAEPLGGAAILHSW